MNRVKGPQLIHIPSTRSLFPLAICRRRGVPNQQSQVALLECRVLLTAKSVSNPPAKSVPASRVRDDKYEDNDTQLTANDRGLITTNTKISGMLQDDDWYKFSIKSPGGEDDYVSVTFSNALGDLDMALYSGKGDWIGGSGGTDDWERISLQGLAAGTYYVRLFGFRGATNPSYKLEFEPSGNDDPYENNDSLRKATNLGAIQGSKTLTNLVLLDSDYFQFNLTETGTPSSFVEVGFQSLQGDIDLTLYNKSGNVVGQSRSGTQNYEIISLDGLGPGTYTLGVTGYQNQINPSYDLSIVAPSHAADGEHTLFLNFDGYNISSLDLYNWSNAGQDWDPTLFSFYGGIEPISVAPFLSWATSREQVISQMMQMVSEDLAPFGIRVVRSVGPAIVDQFATTIFLGPSSHGLHVADDIDYGNFNLTDIAFVGDEWWGTSSRTAIAMADVVLHEAGHTFGLYHVLSGDAPETMGLRYNTPESDWVQDTSFTDQYFEVLPGHGPDGYIQNSYQYMLSVFGAAVTNSTSVARTLPAISVNWVFADLKKALGDSILGI